MTSLLCVLAIQRLPGEKRTVAQAEAHFDAAWADSFQTAVQKKADVEVRQIEINRPSELQQSDISRPVERKVITERIVPDAPGRVPPVIKVDEESTERPAARQRRVAEVSDICTRHKMHKVVTRGGKSWRCKR